MPITKTDPPSQYSILPTENAVCYIGQKLLFDKWLEKCDYIYFCTYICILVLDQATQNSKSENLTNFSPQNSNLNKLKPSDLGFQLTGTQKNSKYLYYASANSIQIKLKIEKVF